MDSFHSHSQFTGHVVAIPYPGRGHINPMLNLCKLILKKRQSILISFILTEEWHGFISSAVSEPNIRYRVIPNNTIPSEIGRANDFQGFIAAVMSKMEGPVETLLGQLEPPAPCVIIFDAYLPWIVDLANRMNIPAASFWPMSATVFSIIRQHQALTVNGHFPFPPKQLDAEQGEKQVNYIPGVPFIRVADLPRDPFGIEGRKILKKVMDGILMVSSKSQYLLLTSFYELESKVIDSLKKELLPLPIYCVGPTIPYFSSTTKEFGFQTITNGHQKTDYISWLDAQPESSVLYISQGSFLSASNEQLVEVIAGVHDSGVNFLWVARADQGSLPCDVAKLRNGRGDKGLVVPWCDQMKVLGHPSIGGFWSHCGWNSTKESAYAGVPVLSFPISWDQFTNSKKIVQDWKIGWKVKKRDYSSIVMREEISKLLRRFMNSECDEVKEMRGRAREIQDICRKETAEDGYADLEIKAFINNIFN